MTDHDCKVLIIGTGPAGLGAAEAAAALGVNYEILEGDANPYGHCKSFSVPGFAEISFDEGPHISFTKNYEVQDLFEKNCPDFLTLQPIIENYWNGIYIPHPVQANLWALPNETRNRIVEGIATRPSFEPILNYGQWLESAFGTNFRSLFHEVYTQKYWTLPSEMMTTDWVGERVFRPDANAMIDSARSGNSLPEAHYITHFRYPSKGGFQAFLEPTMKRHLNKTKFNTRVIEIDSGRKKLSTSTGQTYHYDFLFSSIPTDSIYKILQPATSDIVSACLNLHASSVLLHSFIYRASSPPRNHWLYVYDEDIAFARLHFPKRLTNQSDDEIQCVQVEVYSSAFKKLNEQANAPEKIINSLQKMGILNAKDILKYDRRFCTHANVIFDHNRTSSVNLVLNSLQENCIFPIGRFGKWAYLWSDESYVDGRQTAMNVLKEATKP